MTTQLAQDRQQDLARLAFVRNLAQSGKARRIRRDADLSIAEMARAVGVAGPTVYRWETAECRPTGAAALHYHDILVELEAALPSRRRKRVTA